ncbi:MYBPC1 [Mytilus coruscus]|uniref:MYBPC1 n=1 Tax=Mytilus coruscus TaxID=42192 RepID=A0A6J8ED14_MYTCO|nr:MYBPC1 [Mytilus coruscus]
MFTPKIHMYYCTEGDSIELSCSVYTDNIEVEWYKDVNELHECTNISITSNGNHRMLTILETTVTDSGTYFVKAQNAVMKISLTVKAIFKRRLVDKTNMEGLDTNLECETEEKNCNVRWFRNNVEITDEQDRMKIETTQGRVHTLFISKTSLEDSGTYSIKIKGVKSIAQLDVKGNISYS